MNKVILIAILIFSFITDANCQTKNFIDQPYVEVIGYADTFVTPNIIFIKIMISESDSKNKVPIENQESNLLKFLKSLNINTETELTTSNLQSDFYSSFLKQRSIIKSKTYILKVHDGAMAYKVFTGLEELGISNCNIERLSHTELDKIKNYCRIKAMNDAKQKAISLTQPLNQSIGIALYISDLDNSSFVVQQSNSYDSRKRRGEEVTTENDPIEFEKIKVSNKIEVKFVLK